jgi:sulfur relay (sulfurtransferase) complex TusBCD TusD component (DsrE family)
MAATIEQRRWDLLVVLTAPPHTADVLTTVLRLAQAVLIQGRSVRIWACGYNTMLTQETLGATKPINLVRPGPDAPSAAAVIRALVTDHRPRFGWLVCTACSAERGAGQHIPEVRLRSDARLAATVSAANRVVYVGGA